MKNLVTLILAVVLGLVSAGLNWLWLSAQARPPEFVAAKGTIREGREISDEDLMSVPIPGDRDQLKSSLIPYSKRAILYGTQAPRQYAAGDVFFQRDIRPPAEPSRWDVIGPFRLVSVGERAKEENKPSESYLGDSTNLVTIAVDADFDEPTRRLLEVTSAAARESDGERAPRIAAVQVVPTNGPDASPIPPPSGTENVVLQTISLRGIANLPRVLLEGDMVRFVVPAPPVY